MTENEIRLAMATDEVVKRQRNDALDALAKAIAANGLMAEENTALRKRLTEVEEQLAEAIEAPSTAQWAGPSD